MKPDSSRFDQLVNNGLEMANRFTGWDFSALHGRWDEVEPPWSYRQMVQQRIDSADSLLDMGTGGGEFLASLERRPATTYATEGYAPNVPVARQRLEPLGVRLLPMADEASLPLASESCQLIINRHEYYWPPEVIRVLKPGGLFLTQQAGALDGQEINNFLNAPADQGLDSWSMESEVKALEDAGLEVLQQRESWQDSVFYDIGAIVFFLRVIIWQIPDFTVERYRPQLLALHRQIEREGRFVATSHRFLIEARKPGTSY